jgi:3-carboxy-cis,cis-muconate cycloisomerase
LPFEPLFVPPALAAATGDRAWVEAMLDFEAALARAQGLGELDRPTLDADELARAARSSGTPAAALVSALDDPNAHRGATSQDVMDTAAVLVAKRSLRLIDGELDGVAAACARLAAEHRDTVMAARTLLQQASPTTFGLKAAGWLVSIDDARDLLGAVPLEAELGGAAGTLAALGDEGLSVLSALAAELELGEPVLPWHTRRIRVGQLGAALALTAGALEKIALDLKLMAQTEVGEVAESSEGGRGGSSTLPHKRNPVGAALTIACAHGARAAAGVLIGALAQEHERAAGAWQAEWEALSRALALTGGAAHALRGSLEGLTVFGDRMRSNLDLTGGLIMTEAVSTALSEKLGRSAAKAAVAAVAERGGSLRDELLADASVELSAEEVDRLLDPVNYLGSAPALVDRALAAHRERR